MKREVRRNGVSTFVDLTPDEEAAKPAASDLVEVENNRRLERLESEVANLKKGPR